MKLKLPPSLRAALIGCMIASPAYGVMGGLTFLNTEEPFINEAKIPNEDVVQGEKSEKETAKAVLPLKKEIPLQTKDGIPLDLNKVLKSVLADENKKSLSLNDLSRFIIKESQGERTLIILDSNVTDQSIAINPKLPLKEQKPSGELLYNDSLSGSSEFVLPQDNAIIYFDSEQQIKAKSIVDNQPIEDDTASDIAEPKKKDLPSKKTKPIFSIKDKPQSSGVIKLEGGTLELKEKTESANDDDRLKEVIIMTSKAQLPIQEITTPGGSIRIQNQGRVHMDDIQLRNGSSLSIDAMSQLIVKDKFSMEDGCTVKFDLEGYRKEQGPLIIAKAIRFNGTVELELNNTETDKDYALFLTTLTNDEGEEVKDLNSVFSLTNTADGTRLKIGNNGIIYAIIGDRSPIKGNIGSVAVNSLLEQSAGLTHLRDINRQQAYLRFNNSESLGLWVTSINNFTQQQSQAQSTGYNYNSWGYAAGLNYAVSVDHFVSFCFSQSLGKYNFMNSSGNVDQDTYMFILASDKTWQFDEKHSFNLAIEGGYSFGKNKGHNYATEVDYTYAFNEGSWDSHAWLVDMTGTWNYKLTEKTTLNLSAGVEYNIASLENHVSQNERDSYSIQDGNMYQVRIPLGIGLQHTTEFYGKQTLIYTQAECLQTLVEETPRATVTGSEATWTAYGIKPGKTALRYRIGTAIQLTPVWSSGLGYQLQTSSKYIDQSAQFHLRYQF